MRILKLAARDFAALFCGAAVIAGVVLLGRISL